MKDQDPIYVTQPYLPDLDEFLPYLENIWANKILTNNGPYHKQLEQELCDYLGVNYLSLFVNGTIALISALQALRVTGEVITTPYSFVATSHSLIWNNIKPVFVDINSADCNMDASKIEAAITPQTTAIMPVHCYGYPCNVDHIQKIADTYGLNVIYDAAHAFGVKIMSKSLLEHGDLSVLSFHATKVFNTFEGGAIICPDQKTKKRIDYLKNFGFSDEVTVVAPGINGKMNEFQSALGLLQLKHVDDIIEKRKAIACSYRQELLDVCGVDLLPEHENIRNNFSYFPIFIGPEYHMSRDDLYLKMRDHNVYARRYFYPLISEMPMYRGLQSANSINLPNASKIANQVICLPIYPDLKKSDISLIINLIRSNN